MRLNGIRNPRTLQIGRKLKIPGKGDPAEPEPGSGPVSQPSPEAAKPTGRTPGTGPTGGPAAQTAGNAPDDMSIYVIKKGDTLFTLALQFNTTVKKIKEDNGLSDDSLRVGQRIIIHGGRT